MKKLPLSQDELQEKGEVALKSVQIFRDNIESHDFYILPDQIDDFFKNKDKYSLVIPVIHGEYGEDGQIFAFLKTLGLTHSFSNFETHALCLDKVNTNIIAEHIGLQIPKQAVISEPVNLVESYPLIMKPNTGGSSLYTYKINNDQELEEKFNIISNNIDDEILIQDFIVGDEYSVPVVDGEVLPIMKLEKQSNEELFDYEAKYESENLMKETFPDINIELKDKLSSDTLKAYSHFKIKGYARIDFLVRGNEVFFLEINTIPGTSPASILPKAWRMTGRSDKELIDILIDVK